MIKDNINIRQICFIFAALMPVNKVLMLPSILAGYSFEQLCIPLIINFGLDILVLCIFLNLNDRFPNKTFFNILSTNFGELTARMIFFLYGLFFFLKSFLPIFEQKYYVQSVLYEVFPNIISFFPLLLLSTFACIKGLKTLGRTSEMIIWFTALGLFVVFLFSVSSGDYSNLLPILKKPGSNTLTASFSTIAWFSEGSYMLFFLGHFKEEKSKNKKIILTYASSCAVVVAFFIVFYAIFGRIAPAQTFATSNMSIFSTKLTGIGRFDYVAVFSLLLSGVFAICLPIYFTTKSVEYSFNFKKALIPAIVINVLIFILLIILENRFFSALAFSIKYVNWFFILIGYLAPVLFFILLWRRKNEILKN